MTIIMSLVLAITAVGANPEDVSSVMTFDQGPSSIETDWSPGDGNFSHSFGAVETPPSATTAVYTITELNRYSIPAGTQALGLDYIDFWYADNIVSYVSNLEDEIYWMDADNGAAVTPSWDTADTNNNPFGAVCVPMAGDDEIHVNDWSADYIFWKEYDTSWLGYNSLCDNMGRGMDYCADMDKIFEFYTVTTPGDYAHYVAWYTPGTSTGSTLKLNCNVASEDWQGSGMTLFPQFGGSMGIAVTMYDSSWIRFFDYPGTPDELYYGYGVLPYAASMSNSHGLTYSDELGTYFHAWTDGSDFYISELEVDAASLDQATWGAIKAGF
jgi:hypothetical protein